MLCDADIPSGEGDTHACLSAVVHGDKLMQRLVASHRVEWNGTAPRGWVVCAKTAGFLAFSHGSVSIRSLPRCRTAAMAISQPSVFCLSSINQVGRGRPGLPDLATIVGLEAAKGNARGHVSRCVCYRPCTWHPHWEFRNLRVWEIICRSWTK